MAEHRCGRCSLQHKHTQRRSWPAKKEVKSQKFTHIGSWLLIVPGEGKCHHFGTRDCNCLTPLLNSRLPNLYLKMNKLKYSVAVCDIQHDEHGNDSNQYQARDDRKSFGWRTFIFV